ncbi:MAG: ATP-binding cassette domain-containing protein [Clostridiales bacterium]|nr:ATP-binding cassette domain-containing protein [Clostridiales bacterium]
MSLINLIDVEKYLQEVGLIDTAKKYPNELSGCQRQRIAIARALAQETDVILADEPTGNLDQDPGVEIMKLLKDINSKGKTLIVVTHDKNIVTYCNRRIALKDGEVVSDNLIKYKLVIHS